MAFFLLRWWAPFVATTGSALTILSLGPARDAVWYHPRLAFVAVLVLTAACAVGAALVLAVGLIRRLPEVALLGSALWVVSVLPMVHGLLLPGHLYGPNPGTLVAVMAAVPAALLAGLPLLLDGTGAGLWLARRWCSWACSWAALAAIGGAALLLWPNRLPAPAGGWTTAIVAVSIGGTAVLSLRHLRLFAIGRRAGSLLVSLGFIAPGLATIAFLGAAPLSPGWWLAHLIDAVGVLFAAAGLLWMHGRDRSLALVLRPVLTREPLVALELGLTPVVHDFIAALERKDPVTRKHVVRVAELAMRSGERVGLDGVSLRAVGLGGLLHDVGKLLTPEAILSNPAALTAHERTVIERHPVDGAAMLAPYPHLREAAAVVRAHHERPDGTGYPDGLARAEISFAASIVSVVDAWDAMVSDRPYRAGLPIERAEAILREGAGAQWLRAAVDTVLSELHAAGPVSVPRLTTAGRAPTHAMARSEDDIVDACLPALAGAD
ncbi:MAG: HD domain-containing protein [Gaiellaceae bacterium MAG52_C11]|nr:HD domain-containing protein [Candidatus Gaiellasilicea maunaloa]